eukprot:2814524-Pleurochrysis_carterae.AAC.4
MADLAYEVHELVEAGLAADTEMDYEVHELVEAGLAADTEMEQAVKLLGVTQPHEGEAYAPPRLVA